MNSLPRHLNWGYNPRFEELNLVVRMSFYLRTIIKTCFLHLKDGIPNLSPGLLEIILEYADDHIFEENTRLTRYSNLDTSSTTTLYSVLDHKFLNL